MPAVQRTLAVFERLAGEPAGRTLSELARDLRISPSSLLAILNTLTAARYLIRDPNTRRYHLPPGLPLPGGVLAHTPEPRREFGPVADRLAAGLGETVALWVPDGGEVVLAASREGRHDLRWVPRPGLRRPAGEHPAGRILIAPPSQADESAPGPIVESGTSSDEPHLLTLAAPVLGPQGRRLAALTVTGPAARLAGPAERAAREALLAVAAELSGRLGYRGFPAADRAVGSAPPVEPSRDAAPDTRLTHSGGLTPSEIDDFLAEPWIARLACVRDTGYPHVVPVWYEWDGAGFWIVSRTRTEWADCVRRNPHVSMSIDEPAPPLRRVIVEGQAGVVDDLPVDAARTRATRIAERYLGSNGTLDWQDQPLRPHALIRIVPVKLTTWRGLISHPRYRLSAGEGIA